MRLFDYENKRVIYVDDRVKANELIDAGKAIELDLPELEKYEKQASDIYDAYQKEVERIKNSDNPIFTKEVKEYELNRLKEEYERKSAEVEQQYIEYRNKALQDAKVKAAQATVKVTDADKQVAEQFAARASLQLAGAYEQEKSEAVMRIVDDIRHLTDEQRTALQANASQLLANVDDAADKRKLIAAMQEVRNPDLLALEVAKQLPHTVLTKQRIKRIAEQVVKEDAEKEIGGIDREFYEEHLKGGDK